MPVGLFQIGAVPRLYYVARSHAHQREQQALRYQFIFDSYAAFAIVMSLIFGRRW